MVWTSGSLAGPHRAINILFARAVCCVLFINSSVLIPRIDEWPPIAFSSLSPLSLWHINCARGFQLCAHSLSLARASKLFARLEQKEIDSHDPTRALAGAKKHISTLFISHRRRADSPSVRVCF